MAKCPGHFLMWNSPLSPSCHDMPPLPCLPATYYATRYNSPSPFAVAKVAISLGGRHRRITAALEATREEVLISIDEKQELINNYRAI
ncbi:hypothetical protein Tco_1438082 [Tanacetum coccineum]